LVAIALGGAVVVGSAVASEANSTVVACLGASSAAIVALLLTHRRDVKLSREGVSVQTRVLGFAWSSNAPYSEFEGVLWQIVRVRRGDDQSAAIYQVVELHHANRRRCVPLFVQLSPVPHEALQRWETYAAALDLPVIRRIAGRLYAQPIEDLHRSLAQRVADGSLPEPQPPAARVPSGILASSPVIDRSEQHVLTIRDRIPIWVYGCALIGSALLGMVIADAFGLESAYGLLLPLIVVDGVLALDVRCTQKIRLDTKSIRVEDRLRGFFTSRSVQSLSLDEVMLILATRGNWRTQSALQLESAESSVRIGQGLSRASLLWLEASLTHWVSKHATPEPERLTPDRRSQSGERKLRMKGDVVCTSNIPAATPKRSEGARAPIYAISTRDSLGIDTEVHGEGLYVKVQPATRFQFALGMALLLGFACAGAGGARWAFGQVLLSRELESAGRTMRAALVTADHIDNGLSPGSVSELTYRFEVEGRVYGGTARVAPESYSRARQTRELDVLYLPEDPSINAPAGANLTELNWFFALFSTCIAAASGVVCIGAIRSRMLSRSA